MIPEAFHPWTWNQKAVIYGHTQTLSVPSLSIDVPVSFRWINISFIYFFQKIHVALQNILINTLTVYLKEGIRESRVFIKTTISNFPLLSSSNQLVMMLFYLQIINYNRRGMIRNSILDERIKLNLFPFPSSLCCCISLYCFFSLQT